MTVSKNELMSRAKKVKVLLLDVDGILTDGSIHILPNGNEFYTFSVYDGYGIKLWQRAGFKTGFITGRNSLPVRVRARALGIDYLFQGTADKFPICEGVAKKEKISLNELAFAGDDLQDLPVLRNVGLAVTVLNARRELEKHAHYITRRKGGDGAVREVVEMLLKSKGLWRNIVEQERILS